MSDARSHYELLGVVQTADLQNIKKAFHRLSKLLHPDTTLLPADKAAREFRQVCEAYEFLSDPVKRQAYDNDLRENECIGDDQENQLKIIDKVSLKKVNNLDNRRPLSGGELFSLLLLCVALCISLILGILFAVLDGKDLQAKPSWLYSNQSLVKDISVSN